MRRRTGLTFCNRSYRLFERIDFSKSIFSIFFYSFVFSVKRENHENINNRDGNVFSNEKDSSFRNRTFDDLHVARHNRKMCVRISLTFLIVRLCADVTRSPCDNANKSSPYPKRPSAFVLSKTTPRFVVISDRDRTVTRHGPRRNK